MVEANDLMMLAKGSPKADFSRWEMGSNPITAMFASAVSGMINTVLDAEPPHVSLAVLDDETLDPLTIRVGLPFGGYEGCNMKFDISLAEVAELQMDDASCKRGGPIDFKPERFAILSVALRKLADHIDSRCAPTGKERL